jgi:hypothetical protein
MEADEGDTASETNTVGLTCALADPVMPPLDPDIVADPTAMPVTRPAELTLAIVLSDDDQVAELVMSRVESSE